MKNKHKVEETKTIVREPRGKCGVCKTETKWPEAMRGKQKRFFCMTCERNTNHQKI